MSRILAVALLLFGALGIVGVSLAPQGLKRLEEARNRTPEEKLEAIAAGLKKRCPTKFGKTTCVDVTTGPGLQLNCIYEIDTDCRTVTNAQRNAARQFAVRMLKSKGLAKKTRDLGFSWNYVYGTTSGRHLFRLLISPEDLAPGERVSAAGDNSKERVQTNPFVTSSNSAETEET
jgi:hypothetical protein